MEESQPITRRDLTDAVDRITELIRDTETKLLTAFHGYAKGTAARLQRVEISESANAN
jgi:hypothetical protein